MKVPLLVFALMITTPLYAQEEPEELEDVFSLSLEELVEVKISVPAALTKLASTEAPASVTVITEEDIRHTPARNILDLIEVYVPGAIWMDYEEGPQLGIRGNIANRNFKYLLRVNGRLMNNKGHYGAKSELEQWDLNDIQRIEVIRGPGSVTYGPGAVAGVINIITHDAESAEGLKVTGRFVDKYDSRSVSVSHGYKAENFSVFSYGGITRTNGYDARHFFGTNDQEAGYVGKDILPDSEPLDYFADYDDDPQVKLHLDIDFMEHWRFWSRYTQQGSTWRGNETKTEFGGHMYNQQGVRDRQWTAALQYDDQLRDDLSISTMLSVDSSDIERRKGKANHPNRDHVLNKKINFSETEIFVRGVLNWMASDSVEIAVGTEYSWDQFGPGWGDSKRDMRIGPDGDIVSGRNSRAVDPNDPSTDAPLLFAGSGWSTNTNSFFSEANVALSPWLKLLLSGRADKNTYSDWLFSPRVALISEIAEGHSLKFIAQQSQRMNTAGTLYALDRSGGDPETETLTSGEVIYSASINDRLSLSLAGFWNDAEVIAWNQEAQSTNEVGELQLFGLEPEVKYKWSFGQVGMSYSFVEQLDWDLDSGVPSSGISYSDYNQPLRGTDAVQTGVGNDLNNWPNQALKLYGRVNLSEKLTVHIDGRWLWDYQGAKDGLTGLANAVEGLPEEAAVEAALDRVDDVDAYEYDFRLNASVDYEFNEKVSVQIFAQNLLGRNDNKRYSYDTGNDRASPKRVRFTEEPRTFGASVSCRF